MEEQSKGKKRSIRVVELVERAYSHRGHFIPLEDSLYNVRTFPAWRSYFSFSTQITKLPIEGRVARTNYPYAFYNDEVVLDLDGPDSLKDTQRLYSLLIDYYGLSEDSVKVLFSGGKGFHIHMPDIFRIQDKRNLPRILKITIENLFSQFKSLDTSLINPSGLIRLPNSLHQKGFYCKEISSMQLSNMNGKGFQHYASEININDVFVPFSDEVRKTYIGHLSRHVASEKTTNTVFQIGKVMKKDGSSEKRVICMRTLIKSDPNIGSRHDNIMRMTSWLKRQGLTASIVYDAMVTWIKSDKKEDLEMVGNAVKYVFEKNLNYRCDDPIMAQHCDSNCVFYKNKNYGALVKSPIHLVKSLREYRKRILEGEGLNLREMFPEMARDYLILPGEVCMFTGDTGIGKSALVQGLLIAWKKPSLFFNLEMPEDMCFRRMVQIGHDGLTKEEALNLVGLSDEEGLFEIIEPISHISVQSEAPDIDSLEEIVVDSLAKIVVIDTTDVINVPSAGNNEMHQLKKIIECMRMIAQRHMVIMMGIHHITKSGSRAITGEGGMGRRGLSLNDLTGNRANVTKMDHVFSLEGSRMGVARKFRTLKSRDEMGFELNLRFDGEKMTMFPIKGAAPLFEEVEDE